jgi:DNA-binding NtrC family response regulator
MAGSWRVRVEILTKMAEKFTGLRVLVVDDELLIRWAVAETLTQAGHTVAEAENAKETLQQLKSGPSPDVILLDFRLPDSDDLKLLETIRRLVPRTPVIMMTAFGTAAVHDGALELGAYRVVSKPIEMRDLAPLVQQAYAAGSAALPGIA